MADAKEAAGVEYKIGEDQELRFEVTSGTVTVTLIEGLAEIFGSELMAMKQYAFGVGSRIAVFSWYGCTVKLKGTAEGVYIAKKTPMVIYVNTHQALEYMRSHAERQGSRGPRVMVVGSTDVGKSTYCRILLNYAVRMGHFPTFVDLDVGQGHICIPGTISALYIEKPADPVDGFDKRVPIVYSFGHASPSGNLPLYFALLDRLAKALTLRCSKNSAANIGGFVINTCGWIKDAGYTCITTAAEIFEVDVVIVIDHERLYTELVRDLPNIVKVVHEPKSGGVEERSTEARKALRRSRVHEYFYGTAQQPFFPHSFDISFSEVLIFKIGAPILPDSCMPLGMKAEDTSTKIVSVTPGPQLLHHMLAVTHCESADDDILGTNVAGFICVCKVSMEKQTMTVLSPQPRPLPRKVLLWTDITFMDLLH
ncbi:hypothetical protein M514_09924 [Trichuris suis]|nr:hypothetical protein M514_09924 [Trichuris suis]